MHKVASDPELQEAYKNDPEGTVACNTHGLDADHQQALLSNDPAAILDAIAGRH